MATTNSVGISTAGIPNYDGSGSFSAETTTENAVLLGAASNGISSQALTDGQLVIGNSGGAPAAAQLTAGTGVSITNASGSITLNSAGGGLTWTVLTGASQAAAVNNGYVANRSGAQVDISLPAASAVGDTIAVVGIDNATGWKISQGVGQTIRLGTSTTTTGVGGYLESTAVGDGITLVCTVANTDWVNVNGPQGNITVM